MVSSFKLFSYILSTFQNTYSLPMDRTKHIYLFKTSQYNIIKVFVNG